MKKIISTLTLALVIPSLAHAETWYDDWDQEVRDVTETVQHYGGNGVCWYDKQILIPTNSGHYNDQIPTSYNFYIQDTTDPLPTISVIDDYAKVYSNGTYELEDEYEYQCETNDPLSATYSETVVVGQQTVNVPIQPFPTLSRYETASCMGGTRRGAIEVGNSSTANSMKIRVSKNGFPNIVIYNGPASDSVSFNTSSYGNYNISVKFDNGSSMYFSGNVPSCGGGGGAHPF